MNIDYAATPKIFPRVFYLTQNVSFRCLNLFNTYHVHRCKSSKRSSRCVERAKAHT